MATTYLRKRTLADSKHVEHTTTGERVKRRKKTHTSNLLLKLHTRELNTGVRDIFRGTSTPEKFRNIRLRNSIDIFENGFPKHNCILSQSASKIVEISSCSDLLFVLTQGGVCFAYSRENSKKICCVNRSPDEIIRSLFLNRKNGSLITVSVMKQDSFSSLKCYSTPLKYILHGKPEQGYLLFESECLRWPGFVEFDEVNGKILTFSAQNSVYKLWDMKNYELQHIIHDDRVQEIKISPGMIMLIYMRIGCHLPIRILDIENAKCLKESKIPLYRNKKIEFIEQFGDKLLIKQENETLHIMDIRTGYVNSLKNAQSLNATAFVALHESELLLTESRGRFYIWNLSGSLVSTFEGNVHSYQDGSNSSLYIIGSQDLLLAFGRRGDNQKEGVIRIVSILTGQHLSSICDDGSSGKNALNEVSAIFYNDERNEIYTGTAEGLLHIWSN
ncbi:hypothetical protein Gasu2_70310 [Galdieria sulphuraria]|uniref:Transducin family protein / WD-40 repeat family protein n=1 Tax=Galdieria sulphuraria TaxID=130081 RepID=M2Y356_GALSU|nr:uncharacterized protein Gasu_22710 [Galdieria sulphuraria]EME30363.1 hypothetical protein Gasu_22710 [Galdieria sulphuraria]GJD12974.1 hypothetical protein Gasu2_70310 [Galdieria sulphuraria]|eukprot:XP_005706883.1 hypothetical protein Gasu_22710 [Galdieria sulphuraria]